MLWLSIMTPSEMSKMNKMVGFIRKNGQIDKYDLVIASGISNSYYEKLKPFMERLYKDIVYDKTTKIWKVIQIEDFD